MRRLTARVAMNSVSEHPGDNRSADGQQHHRPWKQVHVPAANREIHGVRSSTAASPRAVLLLLRLPVGGRGRVGRVDRLAGRGTKTLVAQLRELIDHPLHLRLAAEVDQQAELEAAGFQIV